MKQRFLKIYSAGFEAGVDFLIVNNQKLLAAVMFSRGNTAIHLGAAIGKTKDSLYFHTEVYEDGKQTSQGRYRELQIERTTYHCSGRKLNMGRESLSQVFLYSEKINNEYVITTHEDAEEDIFQLLLKKSDLPLQRSWKPFLFKMLKEEGLLRFCVRPVIANEENRVISLQGKERILKDIQLISLNLDLALLDTMVTNGLKEGKISLSKEIQFPLGIDTMSDYIRQYGKVVVERLKKDIIPLTPFYGVNKQVAFKTKKLFPQQALIVNGATALLKKAPYALINAGMGTGKTLMGLGVMENIANEKWLLSHPDKTILDLYSNKEAISYRCAIVAPSHLISKWKAEILEQVPFAKVSVCNSLSDVIALQKGGKERIGKEYILFSKDSAKTGYMYIPAPSRIKTGLIASTVCGTCYQKGKMMVKKDGRRRCPVCNKRNWTVIHEQNDSITGLTCPSCGEVLYTTVQGSKIGMLPQNFSEKTRVNQYCPVCGESLWAGRSSHGKWKKLTHYSSFSKKQRSSDFVLEGNESYLFDSKTFPHDNMEETDIKSNHTFSTARYMLKHMKDWFDLCILDEAHKFSGQTAQANAAKCLVNISRKTLALTGTICNGKASSLFYLLYLLEPKKMLERGFSYTSQTSFVQEYGTLERVLVSEETGNRQSRGYKSSSLSEKPGISPMIYPDFLIERVLQLDLDDFSDSMPDFEEIVETVPLEKEIEEAYATQVAEFTAEFRQAHGRSLLSEYLQHGLYYTDKPFYKDDNDHVVIHPKTGRPVLAFTCFPKYKEELLNKEKKLIEILHSELRQGRNCFVFVEATGYGETSIVERCKKIIEDHCHVQTQIIQSSHPSAKKRESWMHTMAAQGTRCFICNPKVVETGLDFIWEEDNMVYNFPTIIYYQLGNSLSVMMQSSRRSYRLIQHEHCKVFYLVSENTLQIKYLNLMAQKVAATNAIQGKFSSEGLSAMASGVDERILLAQAMANGDMGNAQEAKEMFKKNMEKKENPYNQFEPWLTYDELINSKEQNISEEISVDETTSVIMTDKSKNLNVDPWDWHWETTEAVDVFETKKVRSKRTKKDPIGQLTLF